MYTNTTGIPLSVAAWLALDTYDHNSDPYTISATSLLKPLKSIILALTTPVEAEVDIASLVPSKVGTAVHDGIEHTWTTNFAQALKNLGYSDKVTDRIHVNPKDPASLPEDAIIVWMEKRSHRQVGKWTISGKFDFVIEGELEDFKTTKTYSYIAQSNADNYMKQGSIYKWLNPDIIVSDHVKIDYIFTDWNAMKALQDKQYPQQNIVCQRYALMSVAETDVFIASILRKIESYIGKPQTELPVCTPEELWQNDAVYKYFKNPAKLTRSTKNYTTMMDAQARLAADGHVGTVITVPGEIKRCNYCSARPVCQQAEEAKLAGLLK